jgi:hypothetical protein
MYVGRLYANEKARSPDTESPGGRHTRTSFLGWKAVRRYDCAEEDPDASTTSELQLIDTGGGYLLFRIWVTYHPFFKAEFISGHRLLGVAEIDDRPLIQMELRQQGYDPDIVDYIPRL